MYHVVNSGVSRWRNVLFATVVALLALSLTPLYGQATTGNLIGTVTDPSGAGLVNASVTILDVGKGVSVKTTTNESGNYTQTHLTPGLYEVAVEVPGFKKFVQKNVAVSVGASARLDANLQIGNVTQEVTVSSAPPSLETDRAEVSTGLTAEQVTTLPAFNRNLTALQLLMPGTSKMPWQHGTSENPQSGMQINANGQLFSGTNFMIDGTDNNDPVLGIIVVNPNIDSVGEFKMASSNFDAEFSQAGGAVIQVETKSGTNEFHGSAFDFLQNNIFQARDPFSQGLHDPGTPAPAHRGVPPLRSNQFGGSLGGPIIKNKTFAFVDYEGLRRSLGGSVITHVPTAAERGGNLSDLGTAIYDPATGNADGSGRTPFANRIIPATQISAPAASLLGRLPSPNLSPSNAADPNYNVSNVQSSNNDKFDVRVDHYLSDKIRLFGRYSYAAFNINSPAAFGLYGGPQLSGFSFEGATDALNQNSVAGFNYTLTPTLLTDFRLGFVRYRVFVNSLDSTLDLANQIGIPGLNISGRKDTYGLPQFSISDTGGFSAGFSCNCPLDQEENVLQLVNNWTKIKGNHTVKWGADIRHAQNKRLPSDDHRSGVYQFTDGVTSLNSNGNAIGGLGYASFLLGLPSHFGRFAQISTDQQDVQDRMFYFVQDTWRLTSKLTLNYGIRWDTWFPDHSLNAGQGGRYDVTDNLVRIPGVGGVSMSANSETQWHNFSPRLGIAYALNSKTVVRTGFGRSYFQGNFGWTFNNLAADVYPSIVNQSLSAASSYAPLFPLATAPPAVVFPTIPSNGLLPLPNGIGVSYIPANQKTPSVDSYNFSVERAIGNNTTVTASYVGNLGRHLNGGYNFNNAVPGPGTYDSRSPLYAKFGIEQTIFDKCDCTSSNYNALQLKANQKVSKNLTFLATYTWSKTIDFGEWGTDTNQFDTHQDRGVAGFDRASVFTLGHSYILPFGKGQKFLSGVTGALNQAISGWEWSGVTTFDSGLPFSPGLNNNSSLNSDMSMRPNQTGDPWSSVPHTRDGWFNPAAYSVPVPYTFGMAGRNSLRGPSTYALNWSLAKTFSVTERVKTQFRWEAFNILNHTNLGMPDSGVDSGTAGKIFSASEPMRNMQFALRLTF